MSIGTPPRAGVPKIAPPSLPPPPPPHEASEPRRPRALTLVAAAVAVVVVLVASVLVMTRRGEEPARVAGGGVAADQDQGTDEGAAAVEQELPEAPTPQAPVLVRSSAESVVIRWASAGPGIDRYVVFRDDRRVGRVAPRARRFEDAGLLPDTRYRYRVQAEMDGERSVLSPHLVVRTKPGTLASALLTGSWRMTLAMRSEYNFQSLAAGDRYRGVWDFRQRANGVKVSGQLFGGGYISALLRGTGPSYEGSTRAQLSTCGVTRVTDTIDIHITVTRAATRQQAWRAITLEGTVEDSSPAASSGPMSCGASGYRATLTARPA